MGSIMTSIGLQDNFTNVLYGMVGAINLSLSAMEDMHRSMGGNMDTSSLVGAREEINEVTASLHQLNAAMHSAEAFNIDTGRMSQNQIAVPVEPVLPNPLVPQETIQLPVALETNRDGGLELSGLEKELTQVAGQLGQIEARQEAIAAQAMNAEVINPDTVQEIQQVEAGLQVVEGHMSALESRQLGLGIDRANSQMAQLRNQIQQAAQNQQGLNRAVSRMDVSGINEKYRQTNDILGQTEEQIRQNTQEQERFNDSVNRGNTNARGLMQTVRRMAAAYLTLQSVSAVLNLSDEMASSQAKLNIMLDSMNEKMMTTGQLQEMIFASAERSRGSYLDTLNTVARLGNLAGDAFSSPKEVVAFSEQLNKQFRIAGASASEMQNATLQLTQALASGVLRGDELNSIFEQAPTIIQSIAGYLDVPVGQIREMASQGEITADIVKNAMFAAADETNAKFESMPKTFEQIAQSIKNNAIAAFEPILSRLNEIANSEGFANMVDGLIRSMAFLASAALEVFNIVAAVGGFIADNWAIIGPLVYGAATALLFYVSVMTIYNTALRVGNALKAAANLLQSIHSAYTAMQAKTTFMAAAAQWGFNAALLACPITWIIIALIALIAIIFAVVGAMNKMAGTSVSATGVVCGVFAVAASFIGNIFISAINLIIDYFVRLWNFIALFANFLANVFTDPIGAVARLFFGFIDMALAGLQALAHVIDTLFGTSLADSVGEWRTNLDNWTTEKFGRGKEVMEKKNAQDLYLDRLNYGEAWDKGYAFGDQMGGSSQLADESSRYGDFDYSEFLTDIEDNTEDIKDGLTIADEELKYLRDIAEQETINRFTTAAITIEQTNHNSIAGGMDLDGVITGLTDAVSEAAGVITEGVHI